MSEQTDQMEQSANFQFAALNVARNYRHALVRDFELFLRGNVLEGGAGVGQVTAELQRLQNIEKLCCVEPNTDFCTQFRARFPHAELLEGPTRDLPVDTNWDAILSVNVLEHIEMDMEELAFYHRLLRSSRGALCLFVPARPEIYAPIDADFGHFRRYRRDGLKSKLEQSGFSIVQLRYYNFVGYFAWLVSFRLLKKRSFDVAAVRLFDRRIFPLVHGFESRICAPPIGQSLLAIAVAD
jgi:SAM-dependent methyltransferase